MNIRTLKGIWKAHLPQWVWACLPLWAGSLVFAVDGKSPNWSSLLLFLITAITIQAAAELANTYIDRYEDRIYVPSNPLVTGELAEGTAKKALIVENIAAGLLLVALLVVTLNYYLIIAMAAGWLIGLAYSLPPFRLKTTIAGPFSFALATALIPIAACLLFGPLSEFIIAFAAFLFVATFGANISTGQLRKTAAALTHGLIKLEESGSICNIKTVGLRVKLKTAMALEAMAGLTVFVLVGIFWHLDIFPMVLSIALLGLSSPFVLLTVLFRIKSRVSNAQKCVEFAGAAAMLAMLSFFSVALISVLHWHWGFAILACIIFLIGFCLLFKQVHPYSSVSNAQQV
jgi:4-hydroxybenzoate polyprenyltransferase